MSDPILFDLTFTIAASIALLGLLAISATLLPWSEDDLAKAEKAFGDLAQPLPTPSRVGRLPAFHDA